ncbi:MAG: SUF system NifU family Fe-S cluster assembly protein [Acidobacteria bacterium]|nr:SUF system NifU family Fe-S cluster assembly protein [Acidobacteriota bacterium]
MSDLRQLYQEVILDHYKKPRNFHPLADAHRSAEGYNPLCGDKVTVYLKVEDGLLSDISFIGSGCAISMASASMMTASLKGKTVTEAEAFFERFHALVTGRAGTNAEAKLGKLAAFSGVCEFPIRVKCASLPWHALRAALEAKEETVSTE